MTAPATEPAPPPLALEMGGVTIGSLKDPDAVVLEGVNWSVAVGDYWAIGGLQASGKSDLLSTAAGLMPPLRGTYRVFGHELSAGYEQELLAARLVVGLVFEGGRLLNHLTLADNIALPMRYHQNLSLTDCAPRVQALLELIGLAESANCTPGAISRTARQRVGLARALALKPRVLLLDNPLTSLDPRDAFWWLNLLDHLAGGHPVLEGQTLTLVITGDDLRPWRNRARQFAALKDRRLICLGERADLTTHAEPLLQELLRLP